MSVVVLTGFSYVVWTWSAKKEVGGANNPSNEATAADSDTETFVTAGETHPISICELQVSDRYRC